MNLFWASRNIRCFIVSLIYKKRKKRKQYRIQVLRHKKSSFQHFKYFKENKIENYNKILKLIFVEVK